MAIKHLDQAEYDGSHQERKGQGVLVDSGCTKTRVISWTILPTTLGAMLVAATPRGICRLSFDEDEWDVQRRFADCDLRHGGDAVTDWAMRAADVVEAPARSHDLPLDVAGTAFQRAVWDELRRIPPGTTRSYADIAAAVGRPDAVRAAGAANGANQVAVLIPCHRVIRGDGSLGGYAYGLERKRALLAREGVGGAQGSLFT